STRYDTDGDEALTGSHRRREHSRTRFTGVPSPTRDRRRRVPSGCGWRNSVAFGLTKIRPRDYKGGLPAAVSGARGEVGSAGVRLMYQAVEWKNSESSGRLMERVRQMWINSSESD